MEKRKQTINRRNSHLTVLSYKHEEVLALFSRVSPFFQGPKFFNSLDNKVMNSQSLSYFKKKTED